MKFHTENEECSSQETLLRKRYVFYQCLAMFPSVGKLRNIMFPQQFPSLSGAIKRLVYYGVIFQGSESTSGLYSWTSDISDDSTVSSLSSTPLTSPHTPEPPPYPPSISDVESDIDSAHIVRLL